MTLSLTFLVVLGIVLFILFVGVLALRSARNLSASTTASPHGSLPDIPRARQGERLASPSSEAIQELANQALARAGVKGIRLDFGTAHDGSLEIWIDDDRYTAVDSIPDERIRKAVAEAVASFNR